MFWHDIVYIEFLYCVTNFELIWTWNKVAVVENAKKCRLYPTFPYLSNVWIEILFTDGWRDFFKTTNPKTKSTQ